MRSHEKLVVHQNNGRHLSPDEQKKMCFEIWRERGLRGTEVAFSFKKVSTTEDIERQLKIS
jgi:hypothetical protein